MWRRRGRGEEGGGAKRRGRREGGGEGVVRATHIDVRHGEDLAGEPSVAAFPHQLGLRAVQNGYCSLSTNVRVCTR